MSSQTTFTKNRYLSQAVFIALMGASGSSYAVSFGETAIQSAQHEPLLATIEVKDISNTDDFKVSLANSAIYNQMGLTPNDGIKATFKKTSANSGKIILKSSQPINSPFADVVLNINNNNKKQFMPKTLLMPISEKHRVNVIADNVPQNLPQTTAMPKAKTVVPNTQGIPNGEFAKATQQALKKDAGVKSASTKEPAIGTLASDKLALDGLKAQITAEKKAATNAKKKVVKKKSTSTKTTVKKQSTSKTTTVHKKPTSKKANVNRKVTAKQNKRGTKSMKYVVQRHDNLWTIASEIAKQSKVNVHTVMKTIQRHNPNAFAHGNAKMLIANKTLTLPTYGKIPSQKSLEEAISARRAEVIAKRKQKKKLATLAKSKRKNSAKKDKKVVTSKAKVKHKKVVKAKAKPKKVVKKPELKKKTHVVAKTKPQVKKSPKVVHKPKKAHVSLVAPNSSKSASKKSAGSVNKNSLLRKLKHSRLSTARKVTKVKRLSTKISSYTKKLQLQNRKLAELEARLKKLKGK